mmetsp:Transcript_13693/g.25691  ORF Transcript_13693/g.25691 Transcript_13693/m.25691 type:complete len:216 (-) Transcript_13693:564-1211(-)
MITFILLVLLFCFGCRTGTNHNRYHAAWARRGRDNITGSSHRNHAIANLFAFGTLVVGVDMLCPCPFLIASEESSLVCGVIHGRRAEDAPLIVVSCIAGLPPRSCLCWGCGLPLLVERHGVDLSIGSWSFSPAIVVVVTVCALRRIRGHVPSPRAERPGDAANSDALTRRADRRDATLRCVLGADDAFAAGGVELPLEDFRLVYGRHAPLGGVGV